MAKLPRHPGKHVAVFAIGGGLALIVVAFLVPDDFYYHYPAFLAPFLGLAFALPAARLLDAWPAHDTHPERSANPERPARLRRGRADQGRRHGRAPHWSGT